MTFKLKNNFTQNHYFSDKGKATLFSDPISAILSKNFRNSVRFIGGWTIKEPLPASKLL